LRSGAVYNFEGVSLSVCQATTFEILDTGSSLSLIRYTSRGNTGRVHVSRSSGKGQGHGSKKGRKFLIPAM